MSNLPFSSLAKRLEQLEFRLLGEEGSTAFAELGPPASLERLFGLELRLLLRRGPGARPTPADLVATAASAAAEGALPLAATGRLRQFLDLQGVLLKRADAWQGPLWWQPLPAPTALEELSRELQEALQIPTGEPLAETLSASGEGWWTTNTLLRPTYVSQLATELEGAFQGGQLPLERAGVGSDGLTSTARSDQVAYLDGTEPELLAVAPRAAALIQSVLVEFAEVLDIGGRGQVALAPERAMLARYPAPSGGFRPHLDNPGGEHDNGRSRTLVLYLNPANALCQGGELALWSAGTATTAEPVAVLKPRPGWAALFDSRKIPHQVRALRPGPPRWALTLWFNDHLSGTASTPALPKLDLTDLLLLISSPPLPADRVLFHQLDDRDPRGQLTVVRAPVSAAARRSRFGVVSTVYRCGAALADWCDHHLALGAAHLLLIFDHLEQPAEAALATALQGRWPREQLQVWSGGDLLASGWPALDPTPEHQQLRRLATGGPSSYAVAARQTLNASTALEAARGEQLGGTPLDWLLHLDGDELLYLQGRGRGGADLTQHLAAAEQAGWSLLRYLNHELLSSPQGPSPRFKIHPRVAATILGSGGWKHLERHLKMSADDHRPYFNSYRNGKAAVRVTAARAAAGVHSWSPQQPTRSASHWLAGPSVLHCYCPTAAEFAAKYRSKANAPPLAERPFEPSAAEVAALETLHQLETSAASESQVEAALTALHHRLSEFNASELELLDEAGLLFTCDSPTAERFASRLLDANVAE